MPRPHETNPAPQDVAPAGLHSVFERFRAILHEGAIDKRCQYIIEGLFAIRKVGCVGFVVQACNARKRVVLDFGR